MLSCLKFTSLETRQRNRRHHYRRPGGLTSTVCDRLGGIGGGDERGGGGSWAEGYSDVGRWWRRRCASSGGGCVGDVGVHLVFDLIDCSCIPIELHVPGGQQCHCRQFRVVTL